MKPLLKPFGYLRIAAFILTMMPLLALPLLGVIWLWQSGSLLYWLGALLACGLLGYGLHWIDRWRVRLPDDSITQPSPDWPAGSTGAWERVEALAERVDPEDWPLDDSDKLWQLGRLALDEVARHYHPGRERPLLELTLPHALLIIERASRDMRFTITENVPFSHRMTLGGLTRARTWGKKATRFESVYRAGRAVADPFGSILREFSRAVGSQIVGYGSTRLRRWLLREYVRKVGYYAVELYSGHLLLGGEKLEGKAGEAEVKTLCSDETETEEPLRILVLGRTNSGKSSLINALFGQLQAVADPLADTTQRLQAYSLERDDRVRALVLDSPGIESRHLPEKGLQEAVVNADLILWITAAPRPDREAERVLLEKIRTWLDDHAKRRRPAPLIIAVSHIDQLSPVREWKPPYDLSNPKTAKGKAISAAVGAIKEDFSLASGEVVPISLAEGRHYNIEDGLWAAILGNEDEARRARFLRLLPARQRQENWSLLRRQLANAGRLITGRKSRAERGEDS